MWSLHDVVHHPPGENASHPTHPNSNHSNDLFSYFNRITRQRNLHSPQPTASLPQRPLLRGPRPALHQRQAERVQEHRAPRSRLGAKLIPETGNQRERERECWSVCTHAGAARIFGMLTPVHRGIGTSQPRQKVPAVEGITASQDKADLLPSQLLRALTSHLLPSPWRTG